MYRQYYCGCVYSKRDRDREIVLRRQQEDRFYKNKTKKFKKERNLDMAQLWGGRFTKRQTSWFTILMHPFV